jgi:hypothetical protein
MQNPATPNPSGCPLMADAVEKVENRTTPKISQMVIFLDYSAAAMLCSADTNARGRLSETRCGPSRRCARNASGALANFACYPQKTFSTASPIVDTVSLQRHRLEAPRPPQSGAQVQALGKGGRIGQWGWLDKYQRQSHVMTIGNRWLDTLATLPAASLRAVRPNKKRHRVRLQLDAAHLHAKRNGTGRRGKPWRLLRARVPYDRLFW